jgi:hypothetical protein
VICPDMRAGRGIDELTSDSNAVASLAHATFEKVADAKFAADLLNTE